MRGPEARSGHGESAGDAREAPAASAPEPSAAPAPASCEDVAETAAELRRVLLVSSRKLRSRTASHAVSASQYSVLAFLDRAEVSGPGAIAEFEHVSPPVMTRMLGRLEAAGLVRRRTHPEDGRQVQVSLTDAGTRLVQQGRLERDEWLRSRVESLEQDERALLRAATDLLRRTLVEPRD